MTCSAPKRTRGAKQRWRSYLCIFAFSCFRIFLFLYFHIEYFCDFCSYIFVVLYFLYLCIVVIVTLILALFFGNINHDENDEDSLLLLAFIQTTFQELFSKMDQNADG